MSLSLGQIENMSGRRHDEARRGRLGDGRFELAGQEQVGVARRKRVVERRAQALAGLRRLYEPRRHDDREVGLLALEGGRAEQGPEDRQVAKPGKLFLGLLVDAL